MQHGLLDKDYHVVSPILTDNDWRLMNVLQERSDPLQQSCLVSVSIYLVKTFQTSFQWGARSC